VISGDQIRLRLTLQYDGSGFHGWQVQKRQRTVQGELESALERLTGERRPVTGSGRTDQGVHATGQVAAVDVPARWSATELQRALNAVLPRDVWVSDVEQAHPRFHPRYDARRRTYTYRLGTSPQSRSPFHHKWCWALDARIEPDLLTAAARPLPGDHSFVSFAKTGQPQRGDRCIVQSAEWSAWAPLGLEFVITANRYLHHMVRYLVGTMVEIARGRRPLDHMAALLQPGRSGLVTSPPAPPQGLFLSHVEYSETELETDEP